jgi:hypothetical protein
MTTLWTATAAVASLLPELPVGRTPPLFAESASAVVAAPAAVEAACLPLSHSSSPFPLSTGFPFATEEEEEEEEAEEEEAAAEEEGEADAVVEVAVEVEVEVGGTASAGRALMVIGRNWGCASMLKPNLSVGVGCSTSTVTGLCWWWTHTTGARTNYVYV